MADEESGEATGQREIHLELGGLIVFAKGPDSLDVLARTALGLIGKMEPLARKAPAGFNTMGSHIELRTPPDTTWGGTTWSTDNPEGVR